MSNQIEDFFRRDGSIGLILAIGPDGARFKDIKDQVAVSHDTVDRRISEARNLGLIETEAVSEIGTSFTNQLTESGEICYWGMNQLGLEEAHTEYVKAIERFKKLSQDYTQQVGNESKWLEWLFEDDLRADDLMTQIETRGEEHMLTDISMYPQPVREALRQRSVDPLRDIDNKDFWLWRVMQYPPEPDEEDRPSGPPYNSDSDSDTESSQ